MMRKQSYILCVGLTILFFILTIYFVTQFLFKKSTNTNTKTSYVENFTPGIRKMVRPHLRNVRVATEEYREYFTDKTNQSLKMLGLQFV
jgi:hypothetical protein